MKSEKTSEAAVSSAVIDTVTLELLESWRRADATTDPDEIRAAEQELAKFKQVLNESRAATGEAGLHS